MAKMPRELCPHAFSHSCRVAQLLGRYSSTKCVLLVMFVFAAGTVFSQSLSQQDAPPPLSAGPQQGRAAAGAHPEQEQDPIAHRAEQHMAERRNEDRQKVLVADTDRLLALAQQLKSEVDKSTKDQLSVDVVKRAEQIEKLAHSVKEKMRGY